MCVIRLLCLDAQDDEHALWNGGTIVKFGVTGVGLSRSDTRTEERINVTVSTNTSANYTELAFVRSGVRGAVYAAYHFSEEILRVAAVP